MNEEKYRCPVTFKVFNENSHIVAIRTTGNVYDLSVRHIATLLHYVSLCCFSIYKHLYCTQIVSFQSRV